MRFVKIFLMALLGAGAHAGPQSDTGAWDAEQKQVIEFLRSAPEILSTGDFDRYMQLYHSGYTNWYMTSDQVLTYEEIAAIIEKNLERGLRILDYHTTPLTVEVQGDTAFVRYVEEEKVRRPEGEEEWGTYHFVATLVREDGDWHFWRTNFFRVPPS